MNIKNNINNLRQSIPLNCRLIAVSKTNPVEKIKEAYDAGQRAFGENRVQELAALNTISQIISQPSDFDAIVAHFGPNGVHASEMRRAAAQADKGVMRALAKAASRIRS